MDYIPISEYLKKGPTKPLSLFTEKYEELTNDMISILNVRNDVNNTGKQCLLLESNHINLII